MVSPKYPDTYWSFKHALKFISKKASNPPLGLLTVAAMLPWEWEKKLVDLNLEMLKDDDLKWADYVFLGAMSVQKASVYANLSHTPAPDYSLIKVSKYAQLSIQFSRGCPFNCEFCEITALLGRKVRTKTTSQILHELDNLYFTGFRGNVLFVDDNFIGNRRILRKELLPAMIAWRRVHKHPFTFTIEASINLSDDPELMELMVQAGFDKVFVGIETTEEASLVECNKYLNQKRDMIHCVQQIQRAGIEVSAGFIVGFDSDPPGIFQRQIDFIQKSGIITAMVGLLNAPNRTILYKRLLDEGRILKRSNGDNTNYTMNFVPKMDKDLLLKGYRHIINTIYSSKVYHERLIRFLKHYNPGVKARTKINFNGLLALFRSIVYIGILSKNRIYYWKLFFWSLFRRPKLFPMAITYSIYGYHFRKVFGVNL